jgi:hypothetical protein
LLLVLLLARALFLIATIVARLKPLFAADREDIILDRDLDVLAFETRQFRRDFDGVIRFDHIDARDEVVLGDVSQHAQTSTTGEILKQAIDLTMQGAEDGGT